MKFSTGHTYQIPLIVVAKHRANYYAQKHGWNLQDDMDSQEYHEEIMLIMSDGSEAIDWLENNMNWEDVKDHAILVEDIRTIDYTDELCNSSKYIIEFEEQ